MRWSLMTAEQKAWLQARAQYATDIDPQTGKVKRIHAKREALNRFKDSKVGNAYAQAIESAKQADRDFFAAQELRAKEENARAIAEYKGRVQVIDSRYSRKRVLVIDSEKNGRITLKGKWQYGAPRVSGAGDIYRKSASAVPGYCAPAMTGRM